MEIVRPFPRKPRKLVLFDFDGTLSLIRRGWQQVMINFMLEVLTPLRSEDEENLESHVRQYVTRLTGKQTIYQMIQLTDEVRIRGGNPEDPVAYKHEYHRRLDSVIRDRKERLREGSSRPEEWLLPGSRELLEALRERDCLLYLASGTDHEFVLEETRLLEIDRFFSRGLKGAIDDYRNFSKRQFIEEILTASGLPGDRLAAFGDGFVEIEETRKAKGLALGVASDEFSPGNVDSWKRERLIEAGADLIITDFRDRPSLLEVLALEPPVSRGTENDQTIPT